MRLLLLLGGKTPSTTLLEEQFSKADFIMAADGGANIPQPLAAAIDLIIGDMDSVRTDVLANQRIIQDADQNTSDLEKALKYAYTELHPDEIIILGGSGGRTDHFINNLHICAFQPPETQFSFLNEIDSQPIAMHEIILRLTPTNIVDLAVGKGATVSLFSVSSFSGLTSQGLTWEIENADSDVGFFSQSNISKVDNLRLTLDSGCVYIAVYQ